MTETILVGCPYCEKRVSVAASANGRTGQCPNCGRNVSVSRSSPQDARHSSTSPSPTASSQLESHWKHQSSSGVGETKARSFEEWERQLFPQLTEEEEALLGGDEAQQNSRIPLMLGIASLVVGVVSTLAYWIPTVGLPIGAIGFFLGVAGVIVSLSKNGPGFGFAMGGAVLSLGSVGVGATYLVILAMIPNWDVDQSSRRVLQKTFEPIIPVEWTPSTLPLRSGNVQLQIQSMAVEQVSLESTTDDATFVSSDKYLVIWIAIFNLSDGEDVVFESWSQNSTLATADRETVLIDRSDRLYEQINLKRSQRVRGSVDSDTIPPGGLIECALVFERPKPSADRLRLSLPAQNTEEEGFFYFEIDATQIKGIAETTSASKSDQ